MDKAEQEAQEQAVALRAKVDALTVTNQASYDLAQSINEQALKNKKAFHAWFDPIDDASKKQRQATIAQGKKIDEPLDYVIATTGSRAAKWMADEREKAAAAQREADAKARKKAEDEQLAAAQLLQDLGMDEAAEEALAAEPVIERQKVVAPVQAAGASVRTYYSAQVDDLLTLVKAVAEGKAPLACIEASMTYLNGRARLEQGAFNVPGVSVVKDEKQTRRLT
jgi:hypothetical protein